MTTQLYALSVDAHDPRALARFWSGVLGFELVDDPRDGIVLLPDDDTGFRLRYLPGGRREKIGSNQAHFDMTSQSPEHQAATVAKVLELGGSHLDIGQGDVDHVVMADPEGNEFCVLEPGNNFLAGCPFIGAVSSDGSQAVGYFWSKALDWPLVWDQDEETAIQSPHGGPKITWGGPPMDEREGKNRLHFDLVTPPGGDLRAEVDRLISLGAKSLDIGQGDVEHVVLADPDGNDFCVYPPR
ncbi:VOC family protein [Phytomonospora sp. NPDC050363]|uniref:VOC family protein n=1 Tax=Phytomonospora sp. NPDC050363 TaxID=3155642 RepID=UPI003402A26E